MKETRKEWRGKKSKKRNEEKKGRSTGNKESNIERETRGKEGRKLER